MYYSILVHLVLGSNYPELNNQNRCQFGSSNLQTHPFNTIWGHLLLARVLNARQNWEHGKPSQRPAWGRNGTCGITMVRGRKVLKNLPLFSNKGERVGKNYATFFLGGGKEGPCFGLLSSLLFIYTNGRDLWFVLVPVDFAVSALRCILNDMSNESWMAQHYSFSLANCTCAAVT